jgi:hypothetical protein
MRNILKYWFCVFFLFQGGLILAQEEAEFTIFSTGNYFVEKTDAALLNQLKTQASKHKAFAVLLPGNVVDAQTGELPDNLLLNENHPVLVAPGKTEWAGGSRNGKDFIKQLTDELEDKYDNPVFFPDEACPGPKEVVMNDHLVVILIDTWWWVHKYDRRFNKCGIENQGDVLIQIEDAIRRHYAGKHVVIAGHHTLTSFGNTSGYFSDEQWLVQFPYTFYRKLPGTRYDNQHPDFKDFRDGLLSIMKKYPDVLYVSAGEQNMQYFQHNNNHFIISGSWQNTEYVRQDIPAFGSEENGFAQLTFSSKGLCELNFFNASENIHKKILYEKVFVSEKSDAVAGQLPDSVNAIASERYKISKSGYDWMGENYRDVWSTPIKVPVFDIGTKKGGLKIVKRGGGQQTYSLRLEDKNGRQYVLRSIDKYVEGAVPEELHNTFAVDLVQDQISASNPYAAPVVAALAEFADIFHANPEVVYIPDDTRFGIYRRDVAGKLFLFEDRPDDDRSDLASFGYAKKIVSTKDVLEKIVESPDHFVDEAAVLRARLFDIVINDWDRHDDQWRWARFKSKGQTVYKPIPRDRDQAFFVNEGVIPWIAARKWLLPKIQDFDEYTENIEGQSFNARYFDRFFLTQTSWNEWQQQIDSLRVLLSSDKIDSAMYAFPKEIYPLCGSETANTLKARLENLEPMARELYLSLAKELSITGTDKDDVFEIRTLSDSVLQISGYELKHDGQKGRQFYDRMFYASETKKIHLYGLQGEDQFILIGNQSGKIDLNIIGGKHKDEVTAKTQSAGQGISVYDKQNTEISEQLSGRLKSRYNPNTLEYNREHFEYDVVYPGILSGYNVDDGIFVGGGPIFTKYSRYRQQRYEFLGSYGFATNAIKLNFGAQQSFPLRQVEINFISRYNSPEYAGNYFGMGNDTEWEVSYDEKAFYRLRMRRFYSELDFIKWLDDDRVNKLGPGIFASFADAEQTAGRFVSMPENDLSVSDLEPHAYAGAYFKYELNTLAGMEQKAETEFAGSKTFPTRGMLLKTRVGYFAGLNDETDSFLKLSGDWVTYLSFSQRPRIVYALRGGGEKLFGDYAFHEAAKLGRNENLRGYRESRFYGYASLYLNAEVRIRLKQFETYLLNGTAGLLLFNDTGRVWFDGEDSKKWHNGTGIGLWFSPFDMAVVSVSYAASRDDQLFNFSLNYQF